MYQDLLPVSARKLCPFECRSSTCRPRESFFSKRSCPDISYLAIITLTIILFALNNSYGATITSVGTGNWNVGSTWSGGVVPGAADDVIINSSVTLPAGISTVINSLNINNFSSLTVYGELTVNRDLTMDNNGSVLDLKTGCQVLVKGNMALQNQVSIDVSSYLIVFGNFTKTGSSNQGELAIASAHIYLLGQVSTPWTNFTSCDATYSGTTGAVTDGCDFGNLDALVNNDVGTIVNEVLSNVTNLTSSAACFTPGGNVTLTIAETGAISLLKWYNGTTLLSTVNAPTAYTYTANAVGNYYAVYKIGNNLYKTNTVTVSSSSTPTAAISGTTTICQGSSATLTINLGGSGPWNFTYTDGTTPVSITNRVTTPYTASVNPSSSKTFTLTSVSNSCFSGTVSGSAVITVNQNPVVSAGAAMSAICQGGTTTALGGSFGGGATSAVWSDGGAGGSFANNSGSTPGLATYTASATSASSVTLTLTSGGGSCGTVSASKLITVTPLPTAIISYTGSPFCENAGIIAVTRTGTAGGIFSAVPAGLTLDSATGAITSSTSAPGNYTVSYTLSAAGGCGTISTSTVAAIKNSGNWNGTANNDWNNSSNWDCNTVPSLGTDVLIAAGKPNYPVLAAGPVGMARNLTIQVGASLSVNGNKLQVAGNISNNGNFVANAGTIEMKGSALQTIPAGTFSGNSLMNLIVSNPAGVVLSGTLNLTGTLTALSGNLASGGFLNLVSTAAQTALIDGSGSGSVTGNVTLQRYLPSGFGYKYFSSPFSNSTVAHFSGYLSTTATISTFYLYDENRTSIGNDASGWIPYPAGLLNPATGYAANLGNATTPKTISLSGTVNNGPYSITLFNNNRSYTKGFNLVGNPYPSPIDWNAGGWTKTNIDNAIYFFDSSGAADEYAGSYSSYIGGVSTGGSTNIIPSMQGFFVHVSNPGSGTLGMNNSVRTTDLTPAFKSASIDSRTILRFSARFEEGNTQGDAFVLYYDRDATLNFDGEKDALKLMNTDVHMPNLYAISPDQRQLSINGIPYREDQSTNIPLGIKTSKSGWLRFLAKDIAQLPSEINIYMVDQEKNLSLDLRKTPEYRFYLQTGDHNQRFALLLTKADTEPQTPAQNQLMEIYRIDGHPIAKIKLPEGTRGKLQLANMQGQLLMEKEVTNQQIVDLGPNLKLSVYVVTLFAGQQMQSEKIVFLKQ